MSTSLRSRTARALVAELAERRDQLVQDVVSSGSTWRAARCSRIGVDRSFATCGGSSIMQMSWASAFRSARAAAHRAAPLGRARVALGVVLAARRRDQRVRRERARLAARQVEHATVRRQLRHRAEPCQRTGRVENRGLHTTPRRQVGDATHQRRLAATRLGDEHRQAGALAYLGGVVRIP